jgi:hypothetical protein
LSNENRREKENNLKKIIRSKLQGELVRRKSDSLLLASGGIIICQAAFYSLYSIDGRAGYASSIARTFAYRV